MFKALALAILLSLLVGCSGGEDEAADTEDNLPSAVRISTDRPSVWFFHDDEHGVSCWMYRGVQRGGIDCIPDWQLKP